MKTSAHGNTIFTMLNARYGTDPETSNLTAEQVKADIESLINAMHFTDISPEERQFVAKKIISLLGVTKGDDECLANHKEYGSHSPTWFTDIKDKHDEWYSAYEGKLYAKNWSGNVIQKLRESSDAISGI